MNQKLEIALELLAVLTTVVVLFATV